MKIISFGILLLISGCSLLPIPQRKFPEAPKELLAPMEPFTEIPKDTKDLNVLIRNAADNYGKCYELNRRHESLVKWYRDQKAIFESVK